MPYHIITWLCFLTGTLGNQGPNENPRSLTSTGIAQSNMDIHSLDEALQCYNSAALALSTHKTYKAMERKHASLCEKFEVNPLPVPYAIL